MVATPAAPVYPSPGRPQASDFIALLTGASNTPVTFQTFPDGDESSAPPCVLHGTLDELWERLLDLQEYGHGIFVMPNRGNGQGRTAAHVTELRALWADDDTAALRLDDLGRRPDIIVRSGHGTHVYWRLQPGEPLELFTPAQRAIAARLGTDPKVTDLARVMRLPGTWNLKDRSNPRPVELVTPFTGEDLPRGTVADVLLDLGVDLRAAPTAQRTPVPVASPGPRVLQPFAVEDCRAYIDKIDAISGQGGNAATFRAMAAIVKDFGLPRQQGWPLAQWWNERHAHPPWSDRELGKLYANAENHGKRPMGSKVADQLAGLDPADGPTVLDKAAEQNPRMDPANWVCDLSLSRPWRYWRAGAWADGISATNLDLLLASEGGLNTRAVKAWKKKPVCVDYAGPVYHSAERVALLDDGTRVANTFRRPTLTPAPGDWGPISLVLSNLVNDDREAERWLIGWLAKLTQAVYAGRPARIGTAPVFCGPKGSGKGTLEEVCKALLGRSNVVSITQDTLDSRFNGYLVGALLVFANEVFTTDTRSQSLSAKLKDAITCHDRALERKGRDPIMVPAVENWLFTSNDTSRPVPIERGDRRFTVLLTGPAIGPDLGALVADDARAEGPMVRAFLHHLLSLSADRLVGDYRPLQTAGKADVQRASASSAAKYAAEIAARGFFSTTPPGLQPRDLYLTGASGFRTLAVNGKELVPVITRRRLMELYRAFCAEINAPAQQEVALMAALREELAPAEADLLVDGRREKVVAGLPRMLPETLTVLAAPAEEPLPEQRTLAV